LVVSVVLIGASAKAADGCSRVWSLGEVLRAAKRLDGQTICVHALLRPLPMGERSSAARSIYEAVPLGAKDRLHGNRAGLVDWDKELGIDESLYRPEKSDRLLAKAASRCAGPTQDDIVFDTIFRAVVEFGKGLTKRAYAALPPNLAHLRPHIANYDVELVFLEVLKTTAVCRTL
jgi:hypothetical protein